MNGFSKKKIIIFAIIIAFVAGIIWAGGLFNLLDIIIVRPIVNILYIIFNLVGDFGLAIIIFTVLVKLAMWPLVKRQLYQTKLMKKIQPELAQIKKNCNGNRQLESLQTMDLYKRYNVKPLSSIVTLLIQLPIFVALFSGIRVVATPTVQDNLTNRAYSFVAYEGTHIKDIEDKQVAYLNDLTNDEIAAEDKTPYDFHPQLFGVINLEAKASDVFNGNFSWSALFILFCALAAAVVQYLVARQQMPSGKSEKKRKFRDILKSASNGEEVDESEISNYATSQMALFTPIMMFFIMFNLHGALAFYYFLSNLFTVIQQKIILKKSFDKMDNLADKAVLKELKGIKEAEVITNKKTGTKITRISAKDIKKKRRS